MPKYLLPTILAFGLSSVAWAAPAVLTSVRLDTIAELVPGTKQLSTWYTVEKGTKIRTGLYESYHPNGQKAHEGHYIEGKLNGPWKSWYPNGQAWKDLVYKNDMEEGTVREWNDKGILLSENNYKAGEFDGHQLIYNDDGSPQSEETWGNGKLNGIARLWENKVLVRQLSYVNGRLDGNLKIWWPNGTPKAEMPFMEGHPHGIVKNWDEKGNLTQEGQYVKGARTGFQRRWENAVLVEDQMWEADVCIKGCPSVAPHDSLPPNRTKK